MTEAYDPHASFSALMRWHLKVNGTHPKLQFGEAGRPWDEEDFASKVGVTRRTVGNWLKGKVPDDVRGICRVLFGRNVTLVPYESDLIRAINRDSKRGGQVKDARPNNLPYPSLDQFFVGREDILETLHTDLCGGSASAITGRAVHGTGGVGKTRLAIEYAWRHGRDRSALLFVSAENAQKLDDGLAALVHVLKLRESKTTERDKQVAAAINWLVSTPDWLMILDNVDDSKAKDAVQDFMLHLSRRGRVQGRIVITARWTDFAPPITAHPLGVLKAEDGADLLLARTNGKRVVAADDQALALEIARDDFDGLALALEQASAYISRYRFSLVRYRKAWRNNRDKVLQWFDTHSESYKHDVGLGTTFLTSWEKLSDEGRYLLNLVSFLAPDPIPRSLLEAPLDGLCNPEEALAELFAHSLAVNAGESFQVHRCVQEFVKRNLADDEHATCHSAALTWIAHAFQGDGYDLRNWPRLEPFLPHVVAVSVPDPAPNDFAKTCFLLSQAAAILEGKASFRTAEPLMRRALAINEQGFGSDHPKVAIDLNNLAALLHATNRMAEAEPLMRRALAIDEQSFGSDHLDVAIDLNNLAALLQATNRTAEAERLMRRALAIDEQSFGTDHPKVATGLNNLAQLLQDTNRMTEAEPLMRRVLAINEQSFGTDHPKIAIGLNNLAGLLQATDRMAEAEPLMQRALAIDEQSFGSVHPDVATDLNNLAGLLQATDRMAEAEPLMRRALAIAEQSFGTDHPKVATGLNNLAQLLQDTNRMTEAEPLMRRVLAIFLKFTRATGHKHPLLETAFRNYGSLLSAMGRSDADIMLELEKLGDESDG